MSNSDNDEDALPEGWVLCQSKSTPGRKYYFNRKTGKSSWTRPEAADLSSQSSKKNRREKEEKREKSKKEEPQKKSLKRKSDGYHEGSSPKKKVPVVPDLKSPETRKRDIPSPAQSKNIANKRLKQLQSRLAEEVQREEASSTSNLVKSPVKPNVKDTKLSPKVTQSPTAKTTKASELKSPLLNDSSVQSPCDSLPSIPSPSQFLAANKILSSMKAQLPEEYSIRTKVKAKDTFADIEAGISSQTPDYKSMKHPETPPQFSEANKIVSAIKTKLDYRSTIKDYSELETYMSANDRMEAFRKSLSNEIEESSKSSPTMEVTALNRLSSISSISSIEAMDVEENKILQVSSPESSGLPQTTECSNENVVLVVDTNIFIHELDVIRNSLNSHIKGYKEQPTLLVPWRVINELDRLKDNNNGNGAICKRAKAAMDYLYQSLPENNKIKGQSLRDANSHIYPCELPDDEILNCCLQQAERGNAVILLSNDKNLCNKAVINGVRCLRLAELRALLERRAEPALRETWDRIADAAHALLANILENEMRAKYDNLWHHVVHKPPPWSLLDVLDCLLKHWAAVFGEVFPRIQHLLEAARGSVRARGECMSLTRSDVDSFRGAVLELARKCQIIPDYMQLAKRTVERLLKDQEAVNNTQDDGLLVPSFEAVWTVFSSFCAKLASSLGVPHQLEARGAGGAALPALAEQWAVYSDQTREFALAIHGALTVSADSPPEDERLCRLEIVFKDNLQLIGADLAPLTLHNLKTFCTRCRPMLQEAYTKFSHLSELLDACRDALRCR